jgi:hypothetical protein
VTVQVCEVDGCNNEVHFVNPPLYSKPLDDWLCAGHDPIAPWVCTCTTPTPTPTDMCAVCYRVIAELVHARRSQ